MIQEFIEFHGQKKLIDVYDCTNCAFRLTCPLRIDDDENPCYMWKPNKVDVLFYRRD